MLDDPAAAVGAAHQDVVGEHGREVGEADGQAHHEVVAGARGGRAQEPLRDRHARVLLDLGGDLRRRERLEPLRVAEDGLGRALDLLARRLQGVTASPDAARCRAGC